MIRGRSYNQLNPRNKSVISFSSETKTEPIIEAKEIEEAVEVGTNTNLDANINLDPNNNLMLFICAHKPFPCPKQEPYYKIITSKGVEITSKLEVFHENGVDEVTNMQRGYGEFSRMYFVAHKLKSILPKYVGICHYRRYFGIHQDITIDEIFKQYDVVIREPDRWCKTGTIQNLFQLRHDINDLNEVLDIAKVKYNINDDIINEFLQEQMAPGNNMVILPKKKYLHMIDWLYSIIQEYNQHHNLKTDQDVLDYVSAKFNENQEYQARLQGFLIERLTALYVKLYCKKPFITTCEDYY